MSYPPPYPPAPYPAARPPQRPAHLRGRKPLIVSIFLGVAGLALLIVGAVVVGTQSLGKVNDFQRVSVSAGTGTVTFSGTGGYVAYYEAPNYDTGSKQVPIVRVRLTAPSGQQMILQTPYGNRSDNKVKSLTYDYNGHHGAALWQFHISETGRYRVDLAAPPGAAPGADMAFGRSIAAGTVVGAILVALGILLLVAAIVLLIIGLVKRGRHKAELRTAAYYGGPPPPPGGPWTGRSGPYYMPPGTQPPIPPGGGP